MKTGNLIVGTVHDCNKKALERALVAYDHQLYLKWNPNKNKGYGMWEVRRHPNQKSAVPKWEYEGQIVFSVEYVENDLVNHVMDLPALHFGCLDRIREMDTTLVHQWIDNLEYTEEQNKNRALLQNKADLKYAIKQYKRAFGDLREAIRSGRSPADFLEGNW